MADQFSDLAHLPIERSPSWGTSNSIYRLGSELSVRLPRLPQAAHQVEKESTWLPRLAPWLPLEIPTPVAVGRPSEDFPLPWAISSWLEGEPAKESTLADPNTVAADLGRFVHALHSIDATGGPATTRGASLDVQDVAVRAALEDLAGSIDTAAATDAWEAALELPYGTQPPAWVHGDLMPANLILWDGRLRGVIDFGSLGVGDTAIDSIPAWNLLPDAARTTFRDQLDIDDDTWGRGRGWALSMALIQLPYYRARHPVIAANARFTIAAVLRDHAQ